MRMKITTNMAERDKVGIDKSSFARAVTTFVPIVMKPPIKNKTASNRNRPLKGYHVKWEIPLRLEFSGFCSNSLPHIAQTAICLNDRLYPLMTICLAFRPYGLFSRSLEFPPEVP